MTRKLTFMAAAAVLAIGGSARAAVTFHKLELETDGYAAVSGTVGNHGHGYGDDAQTVHTMPIGGLDVSGTATATAIKTVTTGKGSHRVTTTTEEATASANETVTADFTTPASAEFEFFGDTSAQIFTAGSSAAAELSDQSLSYRFSVTTNSILDVDYTLAETYAGANTFLRLRDVTGHTTVSGYLGQNTTGSLTEDLIAGHKYVLYIAPDADNDYVHATTVGSAVTGSHDEFFSWGITSVPEPATWALMIGGMAGAGAMPRRRGTAAAAA